MEREKQIEEMGDIIRMERHGITDSDEIAEMIYNAGYRKVVTSDWLTKGISEEQLEREKQEALDEFAERLGYRKQSEGEWKKVYDKAPRYVCMTCNHLYNNKGYKYCPNCGVKMKGGAE
jgi:rubrerythrin